MFLIGLLVGYKSEKLYCLCDERWGFSVLKYIEFSFDVRKVISGFVICFFNGDLIVLICDKKYGI